MTLLAAAALPLPFSCRRLWDGMKEIRVFNRKSPSFDRLLSIAGQLNERTTCKVSVHPLEDTEDLRASIDTSDILTNGTVWVWLRTSIPVPSRMLLSLRPELIVSDVIYNPRQTKLLKMAEEIGCPFFNGLYMLLYQGAAAFELWTGQEMPVEHIKAKYFSE